MIKNTIFCNFYCSKSKNFINEKFSLTETQFESWYTRSNSNPSCNVFVCLPE